MFMISRWALIWLLYGHVLIVALGDRERSNRDNLANAGALVNFVAIDLRNTDTLH